MSTTVLELDSYAKTIAAAATPENAVAGSGATYKYAKEVILKAGTSQLTVGSRTRQGLTVAAGQTLVLSSVLNRVSTPARYNLEELFLRVATNGDAVQILLIDPSN